jgi:Zn-dependent protease with chaperone function
VSTIESSTESATSSSQAARDGLAAGAAATGQLTDRELFAPFENARLEPNRISPLYRIGLVLVMTMMVLLPLIYFGLIGLIGYGVWFHATSHTGIVSAAHGSRGGKGALFVYLTPIVAGATAILFMIKPLFAPRAKDGPRYSLDPPTQPRLFQFVERLCRTVRAPVPKRIDLDTQVNASASFRRGLVSMVGNDLVLTIGLPLVSGMTLRQLTGVLAHEFGHFAQGSGMRVTYVIRSVNAWFARVVYDRDGWDQKLADWSAQAGRELKLVMWACQLNVWLARRVLWALMWAGHFVSCFMLRQMEYDADRYEARVAGSEMFAQTADRLLVLSLASQGAQSDLGQSWQANRLADDLPRLILENVVEIQQSHSAVLAAARKSSAEETTKAFATHPADRDRIASAAREQSVGLFQIEGPATVLFQDYDRIASEVTMLFYKSAIGPEVEPKNLIPTARLVAEQAERLEGHKALRRYLQGDVSSEYRLFLGPLDLSKPIEASQAEDGLRTARARMLEALPRYQEALKAFLEADQNRDKAVIVATRMAGGIRDEASGLKLSEAGHAAAKQSREELGAIRAQRRQGLDAAAQPILDRMRSAFPLLTLPTIAEQVGEGDRAAQHCGKLLDARDSLRRAWPHIENLRLKLALLSILFNDLNNNNDNAGLVTQIKSIASEIMVLLRDTRTTLETAPYPYEHGSGAVSIGKDFIPTVPGPEEFAELYGAAQSLVGKYYSLDHRLLSGLIVLAERIETAIDLVPLADPPENPPE